MKTADSDKRRKKKENKKNKNESKPEELPDNEDYIESKKNRKRKLQSQQDAAPEMKGEDENTSAKKNKKKGRKDKNKNKEKNKDEEGLGGCDDEEEEEQKRNKKSRVITDERFASAQFDPRFRRMPRKESKVTIDSRFARIFSDKNFGRSAAPVDKRGKPRKGDEVNPLLHYYLHQKDEEEEEEKVEREEDGRKLEMEVSGEEEEEEEMELDVSDSDGSTSTEDEEDDDDDQYSVSSDIAHYLMANHEDTPITENESHRLAVVNMDWDHIKAVDLYVVMSSCVPKGGQISSVAIYPSEFGLKCMETEAVHGPSALVDVDDGGDDSENDSDMDNDKLRNYELNKLRYYYAVVVCDSSATSSHLYKTLDSTELLKTSNVFDLRFIPDSMEFKHPPRDVATEAPAGYKEPNFQTRALQHSRVKLTWEDDEPERKKVLRRQFNPNQLDELNEYLASTDDSDDDDDDNDNGDSDRENDFTSNGKAKKRLGREKFLALLQSGDGDNSDEDKSDKDMEITFNTELEDLSKRIIEKKDKKSETVWEAVLRKRNEKKKARKGRSKYSSDDDTSDNEGRGTTDEPDDFFVEEPSDTETMPRKEKKGQKSKDKGRNKEKDQSPERQDQEASRAELELLFADDQDSDHGPKGYNLKAKKAKGKKGKEKPTEDKLPDVNIDNDPRFSALLTSHHYALDPTDPQYKRSATFIRQRSRK